MHVQAANADDTTTFNYIYASWGSPPQLFSWSVLSGTTACNMQGVSCDSNRRVVSLSLSSGPSGAFPAQLSTLYYLTQLGFGTMGLTSTIPAQLSTLGLLRVLQANNNRLQGTLPPQLSTLNALTQMQFSNNQLRGSIPYAWGALNNLNVLQLSNNQLTSSIPTSLRSWVFMSLYINGNSAMCGSSQGYGSQSGTNIGYNCYSTGGCCFHCWLSIFNSTDGLFNGAEWLMNSRDDMPHTFQQLICTGYIMMRRRTCDTKVQGWSLSYLRFWRYLFSSHDSASLQRCQYHLRFLFSRWILARSAATFPAFPHISAA